MLGKIGAEWGALKSVAVHRPGMEMALGLLDPEASLYERAFNADEAAAEHGHFERVLKEQFNVKVIDLRDEIIRLANSNSKYMDMLIAEAMHAVKYIGSGRRIDDARRFARLNWRQYGPGYFFNMLLIRPVIRLRAQSGSERMRIDVANPLSNLYFMRDQQLVTPNGLFISKMATEQRREEPGVTTLLWRMLGLPVAGRASGKAVIEGGDYMPMKKFALVGIGTRTNEQGARQLMSSCVGFDEIAVVRQPDFSLLPHGAQYRMLNMHLDTYFNVASSSTAVGSEALLKSARVSVYFKEGRAYRKEKDSTNLFDYIRGKGFDVINLSALEQLSYASNFLCIRDGLILSIDSNKVAGLTVRAIAEKVKEDKRYERLYREVRREYSKIGNSRLFPENKSLKEYGIEHYDVALENLTGGFGGAHCMTAALERSA
ncbi:arginine deiminase family protein [Candidatus Marsarchaeota archaeon]|nr:arginine deiminase family protein [Candidatus Marsarchaeota archaeon]MCL5404712.1 arginine deiminase family protein [Candidatus Marsarchaeota archaeon]